MPQRVAVISGATGGLGSAIVAAFVQEGYLVLACGRDQHRLDALAASLTQYPGEVSPWVCNLATARWASLRQDLDRLLPPGFVAPDVLVCAHGAPPCTIPTLKLSPEDVDTIYQVDVLGTLLMAQVVGESMARRRQGAMVFLSSAHAHQTYQSRVPYCLSKAAICGLARALAVEWGVSNITVNSVSPWQVSGHTRSTAVVAEEQAQTGEDTETLYKRRAPLGRLVTPEDVASTVLWVAENRSMTGQDVRIDCGVSSSMWHRDFPAEEH